jgi:hypothetical protein
MIRILPLLLALFLTSCARNHDQYWGSLARGVEHVEAVP